MTTKTITICGKEVTLAYCYATEIAFKKIRDKNIFQYDSADPEDRVAVVFAAAIAYAQSKGVEPPVTIDEMMFNAKPMEAVAAANEVINLGNEWYDVGIDGEEDKADEGTPEEKNA